LGRKEDKSFTVGSCIREFFPSTEKTCNGQNRAWSLQQRSQQPKVIDWHYVMKKKSIITSVLVEIFNIFGRKFIFIL
jgi:hypothetical protein